MANPQEIEYTFAVADLAEIQKLVEEKIPQSVVKVVDMTGGGDHLEITVVAPCFEGLNSLARHRLVYGALGDKVGGEIHAARLVTQTPQEGE